MSIRPEDLVQTMAARHRQARDRFEERSRRLRAAVRAVARRLRDEGMIERAWLVGSHAWGEPGERSDLDVVVRGCAPDALGAIWRAFSDGVDVAVDVVRFEDAPASLRARALGEGLRLDEP